MKKNDVSSFVLTLREELENFEHYQLSYSPDTVKTNGEWVDSFLKFAGFAEDEVDEDGDEEYDDEVYYGQDSQYEELVNRRKYRSFREDGDW
jgi:hypothetical protein